MVSPCCMMINISVQYNGGFLPDIILLTQGYYHWRTRLNTMQWLCIYQLVFIAYVIEVSNIILSRSERRVQPLFAPSRTQCKTFGAYFSLKTRLNRFFCRLRLPDRINLSSHPCKSRAEVSSYA